MANNNNQNVNDGSASSSEEEEEVFVPYDKREEWKDVVIVPQTDTENAIVTIAYSEQFRNVFGYFRAVLEKDERSERAFNLTTECVKLNASNYTVWHFRRVLLQSLNKSLWDELTFLENVIVETPKNYQVWQHRKCLVQSVNDPKEEKRFTKRILKLDAKNYHCWQHRQWIVKQFGLWDGEVDFTCELIDEDVRNNSAWNHRFFVINSTTTFKDATVLNDEIDYTVSKINLCPHNESSWNYLRGILENEGLSKFKKVNEMCNHLYSEPKNIRSPYLVGFMIDAIEETLSSQEIPDQELLKEAIQLCNSLGYEHDTIRVEYWKYIAKNLLDTFSNS